MADNDVYTDEEIYTRFYAAENRTDYMEELVLAEAPKEVVDRFRVGEGKNKKLYSTLLLASGMTLDEGIYCVQAAAGSDTELNLAPYELILVRSYVGPVNVGLNDGAVANPDGTVKRPAPLPIPEGVVCVMLRNESPTKEAMLPPKGHFLANPTSWAQVRDWASTVRSLLP